MNMEIIKNLHLDNSADLGNGWTVKCTPFCGYVFCKNGDWIENCVTVNAAVRFAEKNCRDEKSQAEKNREIRQKFIDACDKVGNFRIDSFSIMTIEEHTGGDSVRDGGGQMEILTPITHEVIRKLGFDPIEVMNAFNV